MRSLRPILLCTFALTLTTLLAGCGAGSRPSFAGSGSGSGIAAPSSATTPTVTSVAVQVNGTAPNRLQEVQFSEPMNPATINTQTFQITDASGKAVPGVVSYDANYYVASFLPTPPLKPNASYTATITTGVASAQGAHLASRYTYAIKTRKMTDNSPIYVTKTNPGMDATCASTTKPITVTFSEEPAASTLTAKNFVITGPNGGDLAATISINISATVVTLTPDAPLPTGNIMVTVDGVGDLADRMMLKPYTWSFSTSCGGTGGGPGGGNTGGSGNNGGSGSGGGSNTGGTTGGSGSSNAAYVYVSGGLSGTSQIYAFDAAANGSLTPVSGSPYMSSRGGSVAANSSYLFVSGAKNIGAYSIGAGGTLTAGPVTNAAQYDNPPNEGGVATLFLDKMGQSLYDLAPYANNGNWDYQSFAIEQGGSLNFLNLTSGFTNDFYLSFTGNDAYAYGSDCYHQSSTVYGYSRSSSGALADIRTGASSSVVGCASGAAVAGNLWYAVIGWMVGSNPYQSYPSQFYVYTINSSNGTLTKASTAANSPTDTVGIVNDYRFDPTGTYLAVGGANGLQLFTFHNGTLTPMAGAPLLTTSINEVQWDNAGHLYAISTTASDLYGFSVKNGAVTPIAGTPYPIPGAKSLAVQPVQ